MEQDIFRKLSGQSIVTMLKSIEVSMARVQDEVFVMVEMLEALSPELFTNTEMEIR